MKLDRLLILPLAFAPLAGARQDPAPAEAPAADAYTETTKAYSAALKKWRDALRAAKTDKAKEAALRKEHPIAAFWPRFEALLAAREGRALL
jgi:hypothetical protein